MARRPIEWGTDKDAPKPPAAPDAPAAARAPEPEALGDPAPARPAEAWGASEAEPRPERPVPAWRTHLGARAGVIALWAAPALLALLAGAAWLDARGIAAPQVRTPGASALTAEIVLAPGDTRTLEAVCRDYDLPVRQCEASAACARSAAPVVGPRTVRLVLSRDATGCE
jgi:hypothetical protein